MSLCVKITVQIIISHPLEFRLPNIKSANLFLYLPAAPNSNDLKTWIEIRQGVIDHNGIPKFKKKQIVSVELLPDKGGWFKIRVKDIVQDWIRAPERNLGLEIDVTTENGVTIPVGIQNNIPYLQLEIQDHLNLRTRNSQRNGANGHCQVNPLMV